MENKNLLLIGGGIVLIVVVAFFLFSSGGNGISSGVASSTGEVKEFNIVVGEYFFDPNVIEVNQGDKVVLKLKSVEDTHGIAIPEFGISQILYEGNEVTLEFIADKKGEFSFFCNVPCGSGHRNMNGKLVVR